MQKVTGKQFADNAAWKFSELVVRKLVALVISTILARLLSPAAYGVVALTTVFITFSDIFILNGFNVALIRKEEVTEEDYSTVMLLSLLFSFFMYILFFVSAPFLSKIYRTPELKDVLRVITTLLFFQSVATVIRAKGTRELRFRDMSFVTIVENLVAGIIGLIIAYYGFGVWALVAQQIIAVLLDMILLSVVFRWKYKFCFRIETVKEMLSFTIGVLGSSFMDFLGNNVSSLVIGKVYTSTELGYYNRGNMYPETIGLNTYNAINSVLLPTLVSRKNDTRDMHDVVRQVVSTTEYILFPMMVGLLSISKNFILVLLTEKWLPCLGIFMCACISYLINPVRAIGYNIFYALGESKITVKIECCRVIAMLLNLIVTIVILRETIFVLTIINLCIAFLIMILTQHYVKKCINYSYLELLKDVMPTILLSLPIIIVTTAIDLINMNHTLALLMQVASGVTIYFIGSLISKNKNFRKLLGYVKRGVHK